MKFHDPFELCSPANVPVHRCEHKGREPIPEEASTIPSPEPPQHSSKHGVWFNEENKQPPKQTQPNTSDDVSYHEIDVRQSHIDALLEPTKQTDSLEPQYSSQMNNSIDPARSSQTYTIETMTKHQQMDGVEPLAQSSTIEATRQRRRDSLEEVRTSPTYTIEPEKMMEEHPSLVITQKEPSSHWVEASPSMETEPIKICSWLDNTETSHLPPSQPPPSHMRAINESRSDLVEQDENMMITEPINVCSWIQPMPYY